jgi:SAM-dependent methyltransferase
MADMSNQLVSDKPNPKGVEPILAHWERRRFWSQELRKFVRPHFRLQKSARILNTIAGDRRCDLLDVGCGPATLAELLRPNIRYHGIDIAIPRPGPHLKEIDLLERPISFDDKSFDLIVCQGVLEYLGGVESEKLAEMRDILRPSGFLLVSYTNFAHRKTRILPSYTNIHELAGFRATLETHFRLDKAFPVSYNWFHGQPRRPVMQAIQMPIKMNLPIVSKSLAVEYFFLCSHRDTAEMPR